ncbi:16S rRNA (cytidine1402-2'-O)-methyltransferase [Pseudoscourfieldia marina]
MSASSCLRLRVRLLVRASASASACSWHSPIRNLRLRSVRSSSSSSSSSSSQAPVSSAGQQSLPHATLAALEPALYVVATPLGNMEDITHRAVRILTKADMLAVEDTRNTGKLLNMLGIPNEGRMRTHHAHNERDAGNVEKFLAVVRSGGSVALVSDAGTPLVSDPGGRLVAAACREGLKVVPIPGPCAATTALSVAAMWQSGDDRKSGTAGTLERGFTFLGFLPESPRDARAAALRAAARAPGAAVMYCPPHDLVATLDELVDACGGSRGICVARELTKKHEELWRGTLDEARVEFEQRRADGARSARGEVTLVLEGAVEREQGEESVEELLDACFARGMRPSEATREVVAITGQRKRDVYALAIKRDEERRESGGGGGT